MSDLPDNLTPVRAAHVFDQARLADYMKANVEGYRGPISVLQFEGGQSNPTFHVTDGGGRMYVLRKKPPGKLLPSAHAVDREYRVISAMDAAGFPVARPIALCEDPAVNDYPFYVMNFADGRILTFDDHANYAEAEADREKTLEALAALAQRFPQARLAAEPVYKPNVTLRGMVALPVTV